MFMAFYKHHGCAEYIFTAKKIILQTIAAYCVSVVFDEHHGRAPYIFTAKKLILHVIFTCCMLFILMIYFKQ